MATSALTLQVDDEAARAYAMASAEDQKKMQILLNLRLRELLGSSGASLQEIMDQLSERAEARGLTPEILESILHGD